MDISDAVDESRKQCACCEGCQFWKTTRKEIIERMISSCPLMDDEKGMPKNCTYYREYRLYFSRWNITCKSPETARNAYMYEWNINDEKALRGSIKFKEETGNISREEKDCLCKYWIKRHKGTG